MWHVVFYMPGEREIPLLADYRRRDDVRLLGVVDAAGTAPGTPLAEVMGLPVVSEFSALEIPAGAHVIAPRDQRVNGDLHRAVRDGDLRAIGVEEFELLLAAGETDRAPNEPHPDTSAPQGPSEQGTPSTPTTDTAPKRGNLGAALKTLGRIEDALNRDRLHPWLLSVAINAIDGASGSLMLHDQRAGQLYIAAATGLSDQTLHTTRQSVEEGIAGRVARSDRAELVVEAAADSRCSERGDIASAVCVPLRHEGEMLGVLNVNADTAGAPFGTGHLADLCAVGDAMSRILHAAACTRGLRSSRLHRQLDHDFRELAEGGGELETVLAGWSAALAMTIGAEQAAVAVLREDGTLLLAEGTAEGDTRTGTIPQQHPAWNDVLQSGRPVLVRNDIRQSADVDGVTMYFLPVGSSPTQAVLAIRYGDPADAHRFQMEVDGVLVFLERRLPDLLRRHEERDHLRRLRRLTTFVGEDYRRRDQDTSHRLTRLGTFIKQITGALEIVFLPADSQLTGPRETAARDLLERTEERGWLIAVTSPGFSDGSSTTALAVRRSGASPVTGFVLFGKRRLHPADSAVFTPFDAILARHLVNQMQGPRATSPTALRPEPATHPASASDTGALLLSLAREIDRADRYHVAFSLSAFATSDPDKPAADMLALVAAQLRASDLLFPGDEGHLFVLAPEEIHAVAHMETRAIKAVSESLADPHLVVHCGHALYPGRDATPEGLIAAALRSLSERSRDED
jgi:hypothetical protein